MTPKLTTKSSSPSLVPSLTTPSREFSTDAKVPSILSQTFNQAPYIRPATSEASSKTMFDNNPVQPFISSQFSLAQSVPQKHTHSPYPAISLSQQRLPQPDVMQGSTQLMFPSHFQDGRGSLRFRYLNLLARLFPQFSDIFINSVLEDTNCDLLAAAEWLVQLEDRRSFMYPAFETFGTFSNQVWDNSDVMHQKAAIDNQQIEPNRPSFKMSPSEEYAKHGTTCNKGSNDAVQNQTRLPCNSQVCIGANQTTANCLFVPSQPNPYKTTNMNRMPNTLPSAQVSGFYLKIIFIKLLKLDTV